MISSVLSQNVVRSPKVGIGSIVLHIGLNTAFKVYIILTGILPPNNSKVSSPGLACTLWALLGDTNDDAALPKQCLSASTYLCCWYCLHFYTYSNSLLDTENPEWCLGVLMPIYGVWYMGFVILWRLVLGLCLTISLAIDKESNNGGGGYFKPPHLAYTAGGMFSIPSHIAQCKSGYYIPPHTVGSITVEIACKVLDRSLKGIVSCVSCGYPNTSYNCWVKLSSPYIVPNYV